MSIADMAPVMVNGNKAYGVYKDVKVLFSTEEPVRQGERTPASISFVPPVAGLMIAGEVINNLIK